MNRNLSKAIYAISIACSTQVSAAQYELIPRDLDSDLSTIEAFYDPQQDLTWLKDLFYPSTTGASPQGTLSWQSAMNFANSVSIEGITGWRLPVLLNYNPRVDLDGQTPCGYRMYSGGCDYVSSAPVSEVAKLHYERRETTGINVANEFGSPFIRTWLGNEFTDNTDYAWSFGEGAQGTSFKGVGTDGLYLLLVHAGDVGSPVPEPSSVLLAVVGGLVVSLRVKKLARSKA